MLRNLHERARVAHVGAACSQHRTRRSWSGDDAPAREAARVPGAGTRERHLVDRAELGRNAKVTSFYDAVVYAATNLSVGYSDIFAKTPAGKAIGALLMTYGPALATRALDPPGAPVSNYGAPASQG